MFRVEHIPLVIGALVALLGVLLLADAWIPEESPFRGERRRAERVERSLAGEAAIGLGLLCLAAALFGRDSWAYTTVAVIAGSVLFLIGAVKNRSYLRDRLVNRGELRRGGSRKQGDPRGNDRIR